MAGDHREPYARFPTPFGDALLAEFDFINALEAEMTTHPGQPPLVCAEVARLALAAFSTWKESHFPFAPEVFTDYVVATPEAHPEIAQLMASLGIDSLV